MRIGFGYDVHRLVEGRDLILGGVKIPYKYGLDGHSDADVLVHAIIDALLGAVGWRDIGTHFPDNDPTYKNADSCQLLKLIYDKMQKAGWQIGNIDTTIVIQQPKLASSIPEIMNRLAEVLQVKVEDINVKAKTTEKLGFEGRGEGVAAYAVALVLKSQ